MQGSILMEAIRGQLKKLADPEYREFHNRLLPGITGIMGVRTPQLRDLSKQLIKDGWQEYVRQVSLVWKQTDQRGKGVYYNEMILWELCIRGGFEDWDEAFPYIEESVPVVDNWVVCGISYSPLKMAGKYRQEFQEFIRPCLRSNKEYKIRFAVIMMLSHFVGENYVEAGLELMDHIHHQGYYMRMAVARIISIYFIKFPEPMMPYLEHSHLNDWTLNKALQEITESCCVDGEAKAAIRAMKRPVSRGQKKSLMPAF